MDEQNNQNSPFVIRPNESENNDYQMYKIVQENLPNKLVRASHTLGILAIVLMFTFTVYPTMVLGALSIILALLSKGKQIKMHVKAKTGVILSTIALVSNVALVGGGVYLITSDSEYRKQFNSIYESIYGESFDDMLEEIQNGTFDYEKLQ